MHKTLLRQLDHYAKNSEALKNPELQDFLNAVSGTYESFDEDRHLIERSLEISSNEMKSLITLLQATLDSIEEGIVVTDKRHKVFNSNKRFWEIWHASETNLKTSVIEEVIGSVSETMENFDTFKVAFERTLANPDTESAQLVKFKDGRIVEVNSKPHLVGTENIGIVWSFRDITADVIAEEELKAKNNALERSQLATVNLLEDLEEEKRAVEQRVKDRTADLEREKNKLLQVTSNMKGGGILLDETKNVVFVNKAAATILNMGTENSKANLEKTMERFTSYFAQPAIGESLKRCLEGETFKVEEIGGGGRVYEIFFHYLESEAKDGKGVCLPLGFFILFFDITEAKLLEHSKSELVAVASHQLRTPLTAMRGNVEMLADESYGPLNKEQHELLNDIDISTVRLITMVNEMLDITKIESNNMEMNPEPLNVKAVISSILIDLAGYAERHEFTIDDSNLASDIVIQADKVRTRQIFQNLIDNAIKYSRYPGKLEITSQVERGMLKLSFKDNGIGVPQNEQSKLFGRFYRASNTSKTSSSGSGLGLYIVKSIAQQLGGDITFTSEEGVGTTFVVTLPCHAS